MQLMPVCLMLSCLRVSPDRSQFSRYDTFSLSCDSPLGSSGWMVKRKTEAGGVRPCSSGWGSASSGSASSGSASSGSASSGSTCIVKESVPSDSGTYWCESQDGVRGSTLNITITDGSVILESPAAPVLEGSAVVLLCRSGSAGPNQTFTYYKDGRTLRRNSSRELSIRPVSQADQGLYKCSVDGGRESAGSWLTVQQETASLPPSSSGPSVCSSPLSVLRLVLHLVVGAPYLLTTVLLGLIYRDRKQPQVAEERRGGGGGAGGNSVIMEVAV